MEVTVPVSLSAESSSVTTLPSLRKSGKSSSSNNFTLFQLKASYPELIVISVFLRYDFSIVNYATVR